ncbi:hypothetical protein IV487_03465 [Enterococcus saccharolyticus]|uniref:hypothetical protein n=1 Tax=Enterococcus saccharolyticus TaxID=41997 RepID=UPI001E49541A|nr:hypothetical protein [Enterococcus saccharolyticus]MCD5001527.1 hypothetical protein [Enterococcus saccharolyticus]
MTIQASLSLSKEKVAITLNEEQGQLTIFYSNDKSLFNTEKSVYLLFKEHALKEVGVAEEKLTTRTSFDTFVQITPPWDIEQNFLAQRFMQTADEAGLKLTKHQHEPIPANYYNSTSAYQEVILTILDKFGFSIKASEKPKKAAPAKAQHRWKKAVSTIEFYVDDFDSQATVIWQKRNEMRIKKGAKLRKDVPLNKDGSLGLAARFTKQLREEHADKIENFVTTEDVVLKSVNEVGHFLYYAGTNSWLVLKDKDGKSIDEWTVIK